MTNNNDQRTVQRRSVQETGPATGLEIGGDGLILNLVSVADSFTPWGRNPKLRDRQLREFWPTEPILASALYSTVIRNASFSWTLEGPPNTVAAVQQILHEADFGRGWSNFITKFAIDLFTQDNGAFFEVIRAADSPDSPVVGLAHLDSFRCLRTGDAEQPVIYTDRKSVRHKLAWYQVQMEAEFPSPVESMHGMQLCAVSRVLRAAQILRDIGIYQREKIAGDNPSAIYLASGVPAQTITDAVVTHKERQAERGMSRFVIPLIVASLDPTATVSVEKIALKELPDGFDFEESMRWYINQLALGFGADYQDFAPLPGQGLGTSAQSAILHQKSRGRGPAMFMRMMENAFNFHGILPSNVLFRYDEQDVEADLEQAELEKRTAQTLDLYVKDQVLTPEAARQVLVDKGMLSQELFDLLQEGDDVTPDIVAEDTEPVDSDTPSEHTGGVQTAARHQDDDKPKKPRRRRRRRKAAEDVEFADFQEFEKVAAETTMQARMAKMLDKNFKKARGVMGLPTTLSKVWRSKAGPEDIFTDDEFWQSFKADAIGAMAPLVREGALEAAAFNQGLGLSIDMNLVNQQVLDFTGTFATQWWDELEVATRNSLRSAVTSWQETGLGSRGLPDLARALEPTFGSARAKRIAVTEVTQIFDEGNRLAHNAAGIETEEWQTVRDAAVEEICRPLDKQRFPTNAGPRPVKDTHIGCMLPGTRVVATGIERAYRAWYEGPVLELTLQEGQRLTLTPNHPVLTPAGWLAAELLGPGGDVVCGPFGKREISLHGEDIADGPPLIEEVFSAFSMIRRVLASATEFHGDGRFMDGNIDIVGANGELRCACGSTGLQPLHESHFVDGVVPERVLVGSGVQGLPLRRGFATARRLVSRAGEVFATLNRQISHALNVGLRSVSRLNSPLDQALAYGGARHSEGVSQSQFRFASLVSGEESTGVDVSPGTTHGDASLLENAVELSDGDGETLSQILRRCPVPVRLNKIVSIVRREYAGHVYDLQTDTSLYHAAGVVVHNCRCARLPVSAQGETLGG